ncbi:DNA-binding response regulator [Streptomyces polygonati]|uniref:DNA-binding response regulator n=1 Tax=Streptomyces polygonati TaxID=1617087 RepID=A0ABV8HSJ0_9ACTN
MRRGLEDLVSNSPPLRVVAVVAEPCRLDPALRADVIVLGPSPQAEETLPDMVAELGPHGRVLVVSDFAGPQLLAGALRAGAYGCVTRQTDDDGLLLAIGTVAGGGLHVAPGLTPRLHAELAQPAAATPPALARRETETLRWLAAGLTHGQIARRMDLTEATVSTYVKRIRNKLNVGNKADLTRKAIELGLVHESR